MNKSVNMCVCTCIQFAPPLPPYLTGERQPHETVTVHKLDKFFKQVREPTLSCPSDSQVPQWGNISPRVVEGLRVMFSHTLDPHLMLSLTSLLVHTSYSCAPPVRPRWGREVVLPGVPCPSDSGGLWGGYHTRYY